VNPPIICKDKNKNMLMKYAIPSALISLFPTTSLLPFCLLYQRE
jgi:hypothetical protein